MKKIVLLLFAGLAMAGCYGIKPASDKNLLVISGKVEAMGMSTFQYGSHRIKSGDKTYALKSEVVNLKNYEGKDVAIKALKIVGYPVDGGPEFLDVQEVINR